jgi:hypothetical protein
MDDFHRLSNDAKQAWQRGYDLAHPRHLSTRSSNDAKHAGGAREAELSRAVDVVGDVLENFAGTERKSFRSIKSGVGVNLVVMDPVSVEAVIVELDNMSTEECREALGDGFLKGMIAKARAAKLTAMDGTPPTIN